MRSPTILVAPGTQRKGAEFYDYSISLSAAYPQAILLAGGVPSIMPPVGGPELIAEWVARSDGVLLTGGDDVQPGLYRKELPAALAKTVGPPDPIRDLVELRLIQEVFEQRKPLLAICRGHQILNVAFGGELVVDIASELPNALNHSRMDGKDRAVHDIEVEPDSLLARSVGRTQLGVNSTHHQAVRAPARPFRVTARSSDGVIEAMELGLADRDLLPYLLAVQFHPERLIGRSAEFLGIFEAFTRACVSGRRTSI